MEKEGEGGSGGWAGEDFPERIIAAD